ncbi:PDZ domain-containing protein [Solibacillus merdavium]|uniref:PDZ domain-containing protein n=1 Tax=Solibacillus merdavium TaxID=2762218 RepID=A0ABR8XHW1_9BACL|nr:PDZ domain-containing protein [Solibacillus merdavium]MBD8031498.1 PDZ domain-containing protein [Solibacillus merdavium]
MDETILIEILKGIGRFFLNPLLYVAILSAIYLGYRRVKRERRFFNRRILGGWSELKNMLVMGFVLSVIISVFSLVIGLTVSLELLTVVFVVSLLGLIIYTYHLLSPAIVMAIAFCMIVIMQWQNWTYSIGPLELTGTNAVKELAMTVPILTGLLLMAEGILIRRYGGRFASPIMETTKRGLNGIGYYSKQLWVLPVFTIIPGDGIQNIAPFWPQFTVGAEQFSLIVFPFIIGFQQMVRQKLPMNVYPQMGRTIVMIGQFVLIVGLAAYFSPVLGAAALALGAISRTIIGIYYSRSEDRNSYAVMRSDRGVMIAGILPNSPAEKMGLLAGEVIKRVNGQDVYTEEDLYKALQINAAHCRLEVLDHAGELRLTQHVVHRDDNYKIGLLVVN